MGHVVASCLVTAGCSCLRNLSRKVVPRCQGAQSSAHLHICMLGLADDLQSIDIRCVDPTEPSEISACSSVMRSGDLPLLGRALEIAALITVLGSHLVWAVSIGHILFVLV